MSERRDGLTLTKRLGDYIRIFKAEGVYGLTSSSKRSVEFRRKGEVSITFAGRATKNNSIFFRIHKNTLSFPSIIASIIP